MGMQRQYSALVTYGQGSVDITVHQQMADEDTDESLPLGTPHNFRVSEADVIAIGETHGREDGEWGNAEIEVAIRARRILMRAEVPAVMAMPEKRDGFGNVVADAQPEVPAVPAVYRDMFSAEIPLIWRVTPLPLSRGMFDGLPR